MSLRLDDINMRENAIRLCLQTIDTYLVKLEDQTQKNSRALAQLRTAAGIQESPPPASADGGGLRLREKGMSPHREFTPPRRPFNEERLRPFTDYHGSARQRPALQHGMSVDRSEFEQRLGSMMARVRHGSLEDAADRPPKKPEPGAGNSEQPARPGPPEIPDGAGPPRLGRSLSTGRSGSPRTLSLRSAWMPAMPLTPIVTPTRMEYSSITDAIDTSCIERPVNYSPPNTPEFKPRSRRGSVPTHRKKTGGGHHHQHRHRHRRKTEASLNEGLRTAEENEHRQMEVRHPRFIRVFSRVFWFFVEY